MGVGSLPQPAPLGPGSLGPLDRPSEFPNEAVTSGVDIGAGPGSEVLTQFPSVDEQDLAAFFPYLPQLEFIASQPDATVAARNFVRRLRGAVPLIRPNPVAPPVEEV